MENAVLAQLRTLARHTGRWHDCLKQAEPLLSDRLAELIAEKATLDKELVTWKKDMRCLARHLASGQNGDATAISRLADLQQQLMQKFTFPVRGTLASRPRTCSRFSSRPTAALCRHRC